MVSDAKHSCEPHAIPAQMAACGESGVAAATGPRRSAGVDGVVVGRGRGRRDEGQDHRAERRPGCCTGVMGELPAVCRSWFEPLPADVSDGDPRMAMRLADRRGDGRDLPEARPVEPVGGCRAAALAADDCTYDLSPPGGLTS